MPYFYVRGSSETKHERVYKMRSRQKPFFGKWTLHEFVKGSLRQPSYMNEIRYTTHIFLFYLWTEHNVNIVNRRNLFFI